MLRILLTAIFLSSFNHSVLAENLNLELICDGTIDSQVKMPEATIWLPPHSDPFSERISIVNNTFNGFSLVVTDTTIYLEQPTEMENGGVLESFSIDRLTGQHKISLTITLEDGRMEKGDVKATCRKLDPKKRLF